VADAGERLQVEATAFYNCAVRAFQPGGGAWRRAWVSRKRARVGANSGKRSAAWGPASAIARG